MDDKQIILYFFVAICLLGQRKVSGKFTAKNISMLCMFTSWRIVWHHASQTAKYLFSSNLRWISFIKPSLNLPFSQLYRLLSESWSVSSSIPLQFKSIFCSHHNGGIIRKCEFKTILWSLCYPRLRDDNSTCILCKNIENELPVYLSRRVAF